MDDEEIRKAGLKVTSPRIKILELLRENAGRHLSAEDVYKLLIECESDVGLATVYRALTQFESAGLVRRHNFEGGQSVFELDKGGHHDHIVCLDCGHVEEFIDEIIEKRQRAVVREKGFALERHALVLYAHCSRSNCLNRKRRETSGT